MAIVYCLEFPSGKKYIGLTKYTLAHRIGGHCASVRAGEKHAVHNAIRKYGRESIQASTLFEHEDYDKCKLQEQRLIKKFKTLYPGGYNLTTGGESPRYTDEIRARFRIISKNRIFTAETRKRMSDSAKAKVRVYGRKHSNETRAKLRAASALRWARPEERARRSVISTNWWKNFGHKNG